MDDKEDHGDIAEALSYLFFEMEESKPVVFGPLRHPFYAVYCPFLWPEHVIIENCRSFRINLKEKLDSDSIEWNMICLKLFYSILCAQLGMLDTALWLLKITKEKLYESSDEFYSDIKDGLNHCIEASLAHIYFLKGDSEMADSIISKVHPLEELNSPSRAALIAFHAKVLGDFRQSHREKALKLMKFVIKLDPDNEGKRKGTWYFKIGKLLGQLRRINHRNRTPSWEEVGMLERAAKAKSPWPEALASLAEAYREVVYSMNSERPSRNNRESSMKMLSEAKQLFKRAFEMDNENHDVLSRCGNGLMKLPYPYRDINLAKKCLLKAISVEPRSLTAYQAMGTLEDRHCRNLSEALKYYQLSYEHGNMVSALFILEVKMKMDENYNPLADIDMFMLKSDSSGDEVFSGLLVLKGEYLFFHKNDLLAAVKFWKEAILLDAESENITNHVTRFIMEKQYDKPYIKNFGGRSILNLYQCLKYEIRNALREPNLTSEKKNILQEIHHLCECNG